MLRTIVPITLLFLAGPNPAVAQLSDDARISLVTIAPGDEVYSLWGHGALRVTDPVLGIDRAYNYGTFDFRNPASFLARFAYGRLDYVLSVQSVQALRYSSLLSQGRTIVEQELRLDARQRAALFHFLETNALPENRTYRYHFLYNNCSTRIRDALESALGSSLDLQAGPPPEATYRELVDAYVTGRPTLRFFMNLALGMRVDRPVTRRELTFLPLELAAALDTLHVQSGGESLNFVVRSDTLAATENDASPLPWPLIVGWLVLGLGVLLTIRRRFLGPFDAALFGVVGIAGLLVAFLWFVSLHDVTQWNLNLAWAWPTHIGVGLALRRKRLPNWLRVYFGAAAAVALALALTMAILPQPLPAPLRLLLLLIAVRAGSRALPPKTKNA